MARDFHIVLQQTRLFLAETLIRWALWVAPRDHSHGENIALAAHAVFSKHLDDMERNNG